MQREIDCETAKVLTPWSKVIGPFKLWRMVLGDGVHANRYTYLLRYRERWEFDFSHLSFSTKVPFPATDDPPNMWHEHFSFRCSCGTWTLGCDQHRLCGCCQSCAEWYRLQQNIQQNIAQYTQELDRRGDQDRVNREREAHRVSAMSAPRKDTL